MKVVIVGPGAMGSLFAGFFTKRKQAEIWLLDKDPKRAKRIKDSGVVVEGIGGNFKVSVNITHHVQDIKSCDLVVLCVKSYDTEVAVRTIEPLLNEDSNVLTLQNGLGNIEMISEIVGKDRVLGGVTSHGATLLGEGRTYHAGVGDTVIGRVDHKFTVSMRQIREFFNKSGFVTKLSKDINSVIWSKLIINVGINAISSLSRVPNAKLIESAEAREILSLAVTEAVRVAKRKRIKLTYDDPIQKVESVCKATGSNLSSMLQDVLNKKKTEIDYINGAIVRQAKSLNIPYLANLILTNLVKTVESSNEMKLNK